MTGYPRDNPIKYISLHWMRSQLSDVMWFQEKRVQHQACSFAYQIKERTIWVIGTIFCVAQWRFGVEEAHRSAQTNDSSFVPLALEYCVHLVARNHPAFALRVWSLACRLCVSGEQTELGHAGESVRRSFDPLFTHETLLFLNIMIASLSHGAADSTSKMVAPLLRRGFITLLSQALATSTRFLSSIQASPVLVSPLILQALVGNVVVISHLLGTLGTHGLSWVNGALDRDLLVHMINLPPRYSQEDDKYMMATPTQAFTKLAMKLRPFLHFRSVVHRVFRSIKKATVSGTLEDDPRLRLSPAMVPVYQIERTARLMKDQMHNTDRYISGSYRSNTHKVPENGVNATNVRKRIGSSDIVLNANCSRLRRMVRFTFYGRSYRPSHIDEIFFRTTASIDVNNARVAVATALQQGDTIVIHFNFTDWPPSNSRKLLQNHIKEFPDQSHELMEQRQNQKLEGGVLMHVELPGSVHLIYLEN
ncbi:hypothetical protein L218DRAFT_950245 [Marasmius fiardii PR-910]|nr:hypothetical protein L218DRAFT_950245 [Marasmius fiardii PR-910]